ncbi:MULTISPECIES: YdbL family protein [Pseudomonadati]|uniref:YdbL family protein n=1 Tax=Shewanella aestuarii TaxID=1028752 RepID=A0ABT0KWK0_9GAMM|nr:YdbL family protein [Shewanella aestuarii]MCL1115838.1 YdbL family protein [Shewanella aestuarii]GGN69070.1 hypothetical protein GCM10009193_02660 [Shewanella aestuarii]
MKSAFSTLLISLLFCVNAWAMTLQEAKSSALVGEQTDGYLGVVKSSVEIEALVKDINAKRLQHYQRIATKNGLSTASIAKLAAEKAIAATDKGHVYQDNNGQWQVRK